MPVSGMLLLGQRIHAQPEDRLRRGRSQPASWQSKLVRNYSFTVGICSRSLQAEGGVQPQESQAAGLRGEKRRLHISTSATCCEQLPAADQHADGNGFVNVSAKGSMASCTQTITYQHIPVHTKVLALHHRSGRLVLHLRIRLYFYSPIPAK